MTDFFLNFSRFYLGEERVEIVIAQLEYSYIIKTLGIQCFCVYIKQTKIKFVHQVLIFTKGFQSS